MKASSGLGSLNRCSHLPQDSDDEGNDDADEEQAAVKKEFAGRSPSPPAEDSEPEMTEEEKEFQLVSSNGVRVVNGWFWKRLAERGFSLPLVLKMLITKTLLTEILLEVTNEEILHVAKETHRKATRGLLLSFPVYTTSMLVFQTCKEKLFCA